ncbi:hypothetical protein QYE76_015248 [Lolium multiflorum]|uniref:RING-type domain-containing protein n=1 Tax=Lolium multiflorum TaxID=4521 RepID=A0AAD8X8X4_LOLMU|nr:hypothetical protein QYE76_015129 [Lolium multiflorum]KAK1698551.1 hypothetical protein QYE76_015248 [Lolium multiflorum]
METLPDLDGIHSHHGLPPCATHSLGSCLQRQLMASWTCHGRRREGGQGEYHLRQGPLLPGAIARRDSKLVLRPPNYDKALPLLRAGPRRQAMPPIARRRGSQERNAAEFAQRERVAVRRARIWAAAAAAQLMPGDQVLVLTAAVVPVVKKKKLGYFQYFAAVEGGTGTRAAGDRQPECAICLEAFVHGATCSEVPACRHLFHQECIETWMRSKNTVSCPLCRARISSGSEEPLSAAEDMV